MAWPLEYDPKFGDQILEIMEQGLSLAAAAGELGIYRQRVYDWEARHPEFAEKVRLGRSKRQAFLERRLLRATEGPIVTSTLFALKNAGQGDWREKQEIEHSGEVAVSTKEQRDAAVAAAIRADG